MKIQCPVCGIDVGVIDFDPIKAAYLCYKCGNTFNDVPPASFTER